MGDIAKIRDAILGFHGFEWNCHVDRMALFRGALANAFSIDVHHSDRSSIGQNFALRRK
jgi:hypothetical protein